MSQLVTLDSIEPMLAIRSATLPRAGQWHFELKFEGYRLLAQPFPGRLKTRNGQNATRWFPELIGALSALPRGSHVLDGEVTVLDDIGRSDFARLHARAQRKRWYPGADLVVYCAFDLLVHDGKDIRAEPIERRKAQLRQLLAGVRQGILFVDSEVDGQWLFDAAVQLELEGVVAKRQGSAYVGGESSDWLKIKRRGWSSKGAFRR
ncbi:MAG: hypothetical protein ACREX0_08985 [Noviherbaspirillum sp.]